MTALRCETGSARKRESAARTTTGSGCSSATVATSSSSARVSTYLRAWLLRKSSAVLWAMRKSQGRSGGTSVERLSA